MSREELSFAYLFKKRITILFLKNLLMRSAFSATTFSYSEVVHTINNIIENFLIIFWADRFSV